MPPDVAWAELPTVMVGRLSVHDISFDTTVDRIIAMAISRVGGYVVTPNVDYVVRSNADPAFRDAINAGVLRVPDGMWIVYASRIAGTPLRGTVTGRLLLPALARRAADDHLSIALYGAGPGVAQAVRDRLRAEHEGLDVVATVEPPLRLSIGSEEDLQGVRRLSEHSPDIVLVALGAPKQELWMQAHGEALHGAVAVGVGAAFDIYAGRFREAPRWMTKRGFEWFFRLAQEPRRLSKRYLVDDPWILWWAVRQRFSRSR
jgi:N-acetylglucosaminyldiphosphoundecaprenol N-acetyl-beta-D-mannosaminyltransferase